jgi:D-lactate dehydrogenase
MPSALFFEVRPDEAEYLARELVDCGLDVHFFEEPIGPNATLEITRAEILSVFIRSRITSETLERMPHLKLIVTRSTGYDHIDLRACSKRGVLVCNIPGYGDNTVAEHTFALILTLSRNIQKAYLRTIRGDFSIEGLRGFDLKGRTLGVVGAGRIGLRVIRIAKGFDMEVLAHDIRPQPLVADVLGFRYVSLEDLLRTSDIVTLHVPLTPATYHLIDWNRLQLMKRGALLINTSRGAIVDTEALIRALDEGIIAGAGLDVVEGEELIQEEWALLHMPEAEEKLKTVLRAHLLLRRENVVVTPHIGFYSQEALERILRTTVDNIKSFLAGRPQNVVGME